MTNFQVSDRISFLSVNKVWKQKWIANEKYRRIIADQIEIAFFGVKFHSETARVSSRVRRSAFSTYC